MTKTPQTDMPSNKQSSEAVLNLPPLGEGRRVVLVNGYVTDARIGVWTHEKEKRQPIRISLAVEIEDAPVGHSDQFEDVLCYQSMVHKTETILAEGHINLVETLAERILAMLAGERATLGARVKVEKLAAIDAAESVGVELSRRWRD